MRRTHAAEQIFFKSPRVKLTKGVTEMIVGGEPRRDECETVDVRNRGTTRTMNVWPSISPQTNLVERKVSACISTNCSNERVRRPLMMAKAGSATVLSDRAGDGARGARGDVRPGWGEGGVGRGDRDVMATTG